MRAYLERLRPYAPALAVSALVGFVAMREILGVAGEAAAPLDDSFIHLQYARRLAEGHFFSYVPGEGYSSGATSFLWPLLLAPLSAIGLRGVSLIYGTWALGTLSHAGVAVETYRIAERLAGRAAAAGAAAMCLLFGAFAWFAWSGMETVLLAWMLMRAARVAAEYADPVGRRPSEAAVIAMGILGPLVRPEGAICSLVAAAALLFRPRDADRRRMLLAAAPLAGPLLIPLLHLIFAGHATSSTTMVKWLVANPYYSGAQVRAAFSANVHLLLTNLLDGGDWTAIFVPEHFAIPLLAGAVALPIAGYRRKAPFHAAFVAAVALGTLIPCTYLSFLWNRVRYIWPFAGAWFVLIACFAREMGDVVRLWRPKVTFVAPILMGIVAGALAMKLSWTIHDLAQSAHAIQRQQVALGRWAVDNLPEDARIGVNDTGAIAYLSKRKTFDVVGLTTEGESKYWVAGAGSRFEHYEKLAAERRPTHFMVYPQWMACAPVLGKELFQATVTDQSILGGVTMEVHEARWESLGTGALPVNPPAGLALVDEVDVADIESEEAHRYALDGASDQDNQVVEVGRETGWDGAEKKVGVSDGGRYRRLVDRFTARLPAAESVRMVVRVGAEDALDLVVSVGGREVGTVAVEPGIGWVEGAVELPGNVVSAATEVTVTARGEDSPRFAAFHYWFYSRRP